MNKMLKITDPESGVNYQLTLSKEDYDRALVDDEFLSLLLNHAKSSMHHLALESEIDLNETDLCETDSVPETDLTEPISEADEIESESVSFLSPKIVLRGTKKLEGIEELLISEVQLRPPLWDSRLSLTERSKNIKEKLWLEIFEKFKGKYNVNIPSLQKKWKNLRDTYLKTKSSYETYLPSGSATLTKKKVWKFYESLRFLSDVMAVGSTTSNFDNPSTLASPASADLSKEHQGKENVCQISKRKCDTQKEDVNSPQRKFLKAIEKISETPEVKEHNINPICIKISEMLEKMPFRERSLAEIELLQKSYNLSQSYL